jgi:hypothetical protein
LNGDGKQQPKQKQKGVKDKRQPLRVQNVKFAAPLLDYEYAPTVEEFQDNTLSEKPILLYLPAFHATYICPFIQFPELGTEFEVWCMEVGMHDRSTFEELKADVLDFIEEIRVVDQQQSSREQTKKKKKGKTQEGGTPFWSNLFFLKIPSQRSHTITNSDSESSSESTTSKSPNTVSSRAKVASQRKRPIYLVGESFRGLLASILGQLVWLS